MLDLNTLIAPGSGWILTEARDINDRGQIVGYGQTTQGTRAFLLTPVPEPATNLMAVLAALFMGIWIKRVRRAGGYGK